MKFDKNYTAISAPLLILSLLKKNDMYGYQIIKELEVQSNNIFEFKEGSLYPVLHLLNNMGMVRMYAQKSDGNRTRKYYGITDSGLKFLDTKVEEWKQFSTSIDKIVEVNSNE